MTEGTSPNKSRSVLAALADACEHSGYMLVLMTTALGRAVRPRRAGLAVHRFLDQLYVQTVKTMLVVSVVGVFTGMVLALQTGEELQRYGAEGQLAKIVAATIAREMGPFITAVILTATVGASIAAELGTMKVSEEIDALEMMNVDPVSFLVAPRLAAIGLSAVLLTILVDTIGVVGGAVVAKSQYAIGLGTFFEGARETLFKTRMLGILPKDVYTGLAKAFVFGLIIGGLACAAGLTTTGGALGVGRSVRRAVVASVVMVLVVGYLMTWFFWA